MSGRLWSTSGPIPLALPGGILWRGSSKLVSPIGLSDSLAYRWDRVQNLGNDPVGITGAATWTQGLVRQAIEPVGLTDTLSTSLLSAPVPDSVGAGAIKGNASSISSSYLHTLTASASVIVAAVGGIGSSSTVPAPTIKVGAATMTAPANSWVNYSTNGSTQYYAGLFYLLGPPTGGQTITLTASASGSVFTAFNTMAFRNVSSVSAISTASGSGATASQTIAAAVGQMVAQMFTNASSAPGTFSGYSQTQEWLQPGVASTNPPVVMGYAPGATSIPFTAGQTSSAWGGAALILSP